MRPLVARGGRGRRRGRDGDGEAVLLRHRGGAVRQRRPQRHHVRDGAVHGGHHGGGLRPLPAGLGAAAAVLRGESGRRRAGLQLLPEDPGVHLLRPGARRAAAGPLAVADADARWGNKR